MYVTGIPIIIYSFNIVSLAMQIGGYYHHAFVFCVLKVMYGYMYTPLAEEGSQIRWG